MIQKLSWNKILWLITASLSLIAALIGVFDPGIYNKVISKSLVPGTFSQDLMTIIASIILFLLTLFTKQEDAKKQIVVLGILGYLFYAYGIFVIERVYSILYLVYMAIFALSFWSLIYGVATIRQEILHTVTLTRPMRYVSVAGSLLQPLLFYPLWISALLPLMEAGRKIESLYSIYILDLCFIMPAFLILAIMTLKKRGLGLVLTPAMFILGFTLIFSLVIGELVKPLYQQTPDISALTMSLLLSLLFLVLAGFHLWNLKIKEETQIEFRVVGA
jgi:hypothetical protein